MAAKKKSAKKPAAKPAKKAKRPAAKQPAKAVRKSAAGADVPTLFRLNIEVGDLNKAADFYAKLLGMPGRRQAGSRAYFTCGSVTLQVVDTSTLGRPHRAAKALYFLVNDLDAAFERAKALDCLSSEEVHGESGGAISVRPWGERSFYVDDPWENPLCFVEAGTVYPG